MNKTNVVMLLLVVLTVSCGKERAVEVPAGRGGTPPPQQADPPIELLIRAVGDLQQATFIRNGTEHTTHEATEHMRKKWHWKKGEIKTAEDFIRLAASQSSDSVKPYVIRFADGREVNAGDWLREKLKRMEPGDEPPKADTPAQ